MAGESARLERSRKAIEKLLAGRTSVPALETVAFDLITEFGGARAFAKEFHAQYKATDSPMVKAKMLSEVMYLIKLTSAKNAHSDAATFTTEELVDAAFGSMTAFLNPDVEVAGAAQEEAEADRSGEPAGGNADPAASPATGPEPDPDHPGSPAPNHRPKSHRR